MRTRDRVWGGFAVFCWLVTLYLALVPITIDVEGTFQHRCPRGFRSALADSDNVCADRARGRLNALLGWTLFTAPVTLGFVVRWASHPRAGE